MRIFASLLLAGAATASITRRADTYDYIVVGSGPGGGATASNLARAGFSTLLIEAGDNADGQPQTELAAYFVTTGIPDNLHWDFWVKHYADDAANARYAHAVWQLPNGTHWVGSSANAPMGATLLGIEYPRGATLGGSSIINAGCTVLPSDSDWEYIANITGDKSWNATYMRTLFQKVENNQYLPRGTPGHGFDGYLAVNIGDGSQYTGNDGDMTVFGAMVQELGKDPKDLKTLLTADANFLSPRRDFTNSMFGFPYHYNKTWGRSSIRDRILDTVKKGFPLHLQLNSLASKILFDPASDKPKAYGIEFIPAKTAYKADPRFKNGAAAAAPQRVYAKREVIIAGGVFNTPQLLQLSGIGAAADLRKLGIPVVADLPGVGANMQENYEIGVFGIAKKTFWPDPPAGSPACTPNVAGDPCYPLWQQGLGPYTQAGPNTNLVQFTSNHTTDGERDVDIFSGPYVFRGFFPATPNQAWPESPNTWGMHTVKFHAGNRAGYVRIRSTDPTDPPEINFNHFAQGAAADLGAMKDVVRFARRALMRVGAPYGPIEITHPPCPAPASLLPDGSCSDPAADETWIRDNTFGHHATSTAAMGNLSDPMTVVDSKFRVKGVANLRIVDGSIFPLSIGSFPVISTYMISEKASLDILAAN